MANFDISHLVLLNHHHKNKLSVSENSFSSHVFYYILNTYWFHSIVCMSCVTPAADKNKKGVTKNKTK